MSKKNYNVLALRGFQMDDMEYIKQFNLDPNLAYTPKLNDFMLDKVYEENIKGLQDYHGLAEKDAKREAGRMRASAKRQIESLLRGK